VTLPDGTVAQKVLCPEQTKILGFLSVNFLHSQLYSVTLTLYSLAFRSLYACFVKIMRFKSKSTTTSVTTIYICIVLSYNYAYTYLAAPFHYLSEDARAQNELFIPYGKQVRDSVAEI